MKRRLQVPRAALVWLVLAGAAFAATPPKIGTGPTPAWVEALPVPPPDARVSGGAWLLWDEQVKADEQADYVHVARRVVTREEIEDGSRLSISINPEYQSLTFHQLVVHRDGRAEDRLARQEIKVLQREERMDWNMFDGRVSAVIFIEDIRPGDVVEYAYTRAGQNPIFEGRYMDSFSFRWSVPLARMRFRLLWPSERHLSYQPHAGKIEPKITQPSPGVTEYRWEATDIKPVIADDDLPEWYDPYGWVQLSEYGSWNEVARWAASIYPKTDQIPAELETELKRLHEIPGEKDRILAALRYVQDNIRYLGMEVGPNSHKPHHVEEVLQRRFGDCKDKSVLLSVMLRQLGFQASPALVSTDDGPVLTEWLPSAWAFDHVVVRVLYQDRAYWLDPTDSNQGGSLDDLYFPAYGYALVVEPETESLVKVTPSGFDETLTEVKETYDFENFQGGFTLRVHTIYRGADAERMRSQLAESTMEKMEKNYLNYYAREFPKIEVVERLKFDDHREKNIIESDEAYRVTGFWDVPEEGSQAVGKFNSRTVNEAISSPDTPLRTMPYALKYPRRIHNTIELNFPENLGLGGDQLTVEDPAFRYTFSRKPSGRRMTLVYEYESRADHVEAKAIASYLAHVEKAENTLGYTVRIPKWKVGNSASAGLPVAVGAASGSWSGLLSLGLLLFAVGAVWWFQRRSRPSRAVEYAAAIHQCATCGATEHTHSDLEFRVAGDGREYCRHHLGGGQ